LEDATASAVPDGSLLHRHHHHQAVRMDSAGTATSNNNNHNSKHSKQMVPRKKKGNIKTKEWIVHKKQTQRQKGKAVRPDTKYTARRRPTKF
jgi:18S rRNA (guanine1575-N7)-methyltransferase